MTKKKSKPEYVFKKHASIGAADAEEDEKYLRSCFVDTGDLDALVDCADSKRIVVGRTGVGKSALLKQLGKVEDHVISLPPETLSLNYISNSDVLNFFENAGVKLDIFYQLLWRHVFTVELLKSKYTIKDEGSNRSFLDRMRETFSRDRNKEKGVEYLQRWGEKFWQETEYRIKEFTIKLENDLAAGISGKISGLSLNASTAEKLTEQQKHEVLHKGQRVVNSVQIKDLGEVVRLLAEDVFVDPQERFYITIDRLDENWAEERIRFQLIRALIETIRHFQKVRSVKIIIVLRIDLLERVFESTRDSGFQEEKYESLYLPVLWNVQQLETLLDIRVAALIREQYTKREVRLTDIMPKRLGSISAIQYILDRTFMRPRDAILFLNMCLEKSEGKAKVGVGDVRAAEGEYSGRRLRSLNDEWGGLFPSLLEYGRILEKRKSSFRYKDITDAQVENFVMELCNGRFCKMDPVYAQGQKFVDGKKTASGLLNFLFRTMYKIGIVGIKTDSHTPVRWSHLNEATLHEGEVKPTSIIYIHPTFWRIFGIEESVLRDGIENL